MKFNWGTGIFLFLVMFLAGAAVFIVFAARQQVNLVHEDYYEEGVDYSEQMKVDARSKAYAHSIKISNTNDALVIDFDESLSSKVDSGEMYLYRPSDKTKDIKIPVYAKTANMNFQKDDLLNGRYILKFTWYSQGIKYQIDRPINVQ